MKYQDIINLPRYEIKNHKKMSIKERAAQFMPFSALNTYEDKIEEASEIKENRIELSEDKQIQIENILNNLKPNSKIAVTYFNNGKYEKYTGNIKKIDNIKKELIFLNQKIVNLKDIISINQ